MNIIVLHVVGATCGFGEQHKARIGKFSTDLTAAHPDQIRMAAKPENFASTGFFHSCLFRGDDRHGRRRAKAPRTGQDITRDGGLILEPVGTAKAASLGNAMRRIGSESIVMRNCFTTVKGSACSEFHQKHSN